MSTEPTSPSATRSEESPAVRQARVAVARNIAAEVTRAGHTPIAYISEVLGKHESTIRRRHEGQIPYFTEDFAALSDALGVPIGKFFEGVGA